MLLVVGGTERTWEKPGGGTQMSTVQSRKSREAGKPGRKVAARRNIRRPCTSPNILSIWQNPTLNKKSSRSLHPATFSASSTKWGAKTWMSTVGNLSTIMLESCAWMTGPSKLPGKNIMNTYGTRTPSQKSIPWKARHPHPNTHPHPTWAGDQADEMWQGCWYIPDFTEIVKASGVEGPQQIRDLLEDNLHFWEDPYWMGGEYHRLPLQGQGRRPWVRELSRPQIARPGHGGSRQGGWELSTTTSVHRWHVVWIHAWMQQPYSLYPSYKKNLCRQ